MTNWISVTDRLPPLEEVVIVAIDYGPNRQGDSTPLRLAFGARCDDVDGWLWGISSYGPFIPSEGAGGADVQVDDDYPVTHWMPLPEMPS